MLKINVKSNVKKFTRNLNNIQRKQIPFATARALTWTAGAAQTDIQKKIPKTFQTTRKWWLKQQPTGVKVRPAKKNALTATVYTNAYFAKLQEEGGLKAPFKAGGLLIPSDKVPKYGRKAGGARKVLQQKKVLKRGGMAGGDPVITLKSGKRGVFRRRTKKRLPIELMYTYVPQASVRGRFGFKKTAATAAKRDFEKLFAKSLNMALKSAR